MGDKPEGDKMIYYSKDDIVIRNLEQRDISVITDEEVAQGWHVTTEKYETRFRHQAEGKAIALVAEYKGNVAGYINVYPVSECGPYIEKGYPEIVDFGVLVKYRRNGIGSKLMDIAEKVASEYSDTVCLGVGLHSGYGSAQRMYVKRGYVPDGTGVWYGPEACKPYEDYCNDDDLTLYMSKRIV